MTSQEIIERFELYVDDTTELSTQEELDLLQKIYDKVCDETPWEILKTESSGTLSTSTTITLPADFNRLVANSNFTQNNWQNEANTSGRVVWLGTGSAASPYIVVDWSDRKRYISSNGFAYLDMANNQLVFTVPQSTGIAYSFDYLKTPTALTLGTSPIFPARFHHIFYHGMASEDMIIQLFDKARSYAGENNAKYLEWLGQMKMWNANLQNS